MAVPSKLSKRGILLWILSLAALSVGARNFEEGLSLDAPVYSTIARNIARTGDWVRMDAQIPDFVPFAEHPHLGFWLMGAWLKVLPAKDWAVRIPGHLCYLVFLFSLFIYIRNRSSEAVAAWTIVFLWTCHLFSNTFSTFYLDPGVLCLGTFSLWAFERGGKGRILFWSLLSGALMGLAVVYKGLTVFGFLPVLGWLIFDRFWFQQQGKKALTAMIVFLVGTSAVIGLYLWILRQSDLPNFLDIYFSRQVTNRFARKWSLLSLFSVPFWWQLLKYSNFLLPFALLTLPSVRTKRYLIFPWLFALSFLFMFATSGLVGGQYLIMMLPWIGWLVAEALLAKLPLSPQKLMATTSTLSLVAVFILQYVPVSTHGNGLTSDIQKLRKLSETGRVKELTLEHFAPKDPFVISGGYAWYADVRVRYAEDDVNLTAVAAPGAAYYLRGVNAEREKILEKRGWCREPQTEDGSLWLPCASGL